MKKTSIHYGRISFCRGKKMIREMKFTSFLFISLLLFFSTVANAQDGKTVSGQIIDTNGGSLPGVSVVVKGTTNGTITDVNGDYTIKVSSENDVLVYSFIGMKNQEIAVAGKTTINVTMEEEFIGLDEVVAVGYGVQKKKLITGATTQVKGEDLTKMATTNIVEALKGQTPGLQISSGSAQPGETPKIIVRGTGTVNNSKPLFIVDGVQTDDISFLNSNDIESFDVLKDAASAAIYGVNGANGVILITTKTGKSGKMQLSYDGYMGVQNLYKKMPFLNAKEYAVIMNEQNLNSGQDPAFPTDAASMAALGEGTDWVNELVTNNAKMQNHSFAVSGGSEQSVYSMGLSYTDQDGVVGGSDKSHYERYSFRVNSEHKVYKNYIKVGEHLNYSNTLKRGISTNNLYDNILVKAYSTTSLLDPYNSQPQLDENDPYKGARPTSPVLFMKYNYNNVNKQDKVLGDVYMEVEPIKGLTLKTSFAMDYTSGSYRDFTPTYNIGYEAIHAISTGSQRMWSHKVMTWDNTLRYVKSLGGSHFDGLVGMSAKRNTGDNMYATRSDFFIEEFDYAYLKNAQELPTGTGDLTANPDDTERLLSYFGRVNYDYNEKYLLTLIYRADGSTRFSSKHRWAYFPSASAGWVVTNEPFMNSAESWLDFLKLRASWGTNGNQNIPNFLWMATLTPEDGGYSFGSEEGSLATGLYGKKLSNPDLMWETSEQLNVGFDAMFFGNKLSSSFEYYKKTTKDWIVDAPVAAISGAEPPFINGGSVENRGVELTLGYHGNVNKLRYNVNANIAYNTNEVTYVGNASGFFAGGNNLLYTNAGYTSRVAKGNPIGYFYGLKTDGIFQNDAEVQGYKSEDGTLIQPLAEPGDIKFVDVSGADGVPDGKIDDNDRTMIGDPSPDYILGFSFDLKYKGFDFSVVTQGEFGKQIAMGFMHNFRSPKSNYHQDYLNRWHGEGTSNYWPRVTNNTEGNGNWTYMNDLLLSDGDYLKISNVTIGYDFKQLWKNSPLGQMRLYITAQNLYTFTNYIGMDPEANFGVKDQFDHEFVQGIDVGYYPHPRNFLMGLNVKF